MNSIARHSPSLLKRPSQIVESLSFGNQQLQQWRGIRVKVLNGNLESALTFMQRKMQSSGMERLIKREQTHHIKNSEKRVLARKNLERKLRSQELARKLQSILIKKVRYFWSFRFFFLKYYYSYCFYLCSCIFYFFSISKLVVETGYALLIIGSE